MEPLDHLIQRCQKGESAAFDDLFNHFQAQVYRLAITILRDRQEAEDVTQDVFLRVLRRIDAYRYESAFSTWLTAIVVNACRDRLRRQRLRQMLPLSWLHSLSNHEDVPEIVADRQQKSSLWGQVDRLDEKYRLPVILFYGEGLPADEVAQALDLPVSTIYARLNTARVQLRAVLQDPQSLAPGKVKVESW